MLVVKTYNCCEKNRQLNAKFISSIWIGIGFIRHINNFTMNIIKNTNYLLLFLY